MPVPKGASLDPAQTRATILGAATRLLYERGIDGIGVAELCAAVGASKETLYRHFGSKDGLVQAVLEARSDRVVRWLREAADSAGEDPAEQLAAVFDALGRWYAEPGFRGCAIVNAAAQRHDGGSRAVAARHLGRHLQLLTGIARRAGAADPDRLGKQLLALVEGATVLADHYAGTGADDGANDGAEDGADTGAAGLAKHAALALLRQETAPASS
ncbi:TetR/AcrR family transcriptional regulator [Nonomuraea sp. NPDC049709]|uniref:TetR/AcrR family transcriptional regulator n=1 Tax=Nonomuraea sp. NPDC049709 TaxID=3154736 RepID=UPI00341DD2FF